MSRLPVVTSNPGNIATVGIQLYRSRFKFYFKQAALAYLWLVIPVWGWAEFFAISTLISHSAFNDLVEQHISIDELRHQTKRRKWSILLINSLVILIVFAIVFTALLGVSTLTAIVEIATGYHFPRNPKDLSSFILTSIIFVFLAIVGVWRYARYFIIEIVVVVENQLRLFTIQRRCKELAKDSSLLLVGTILVTFVMTFPLSFAITWIVSELSRILIRLLPIAVSSRITILWLVLALISLLTALVTMPFWQTTKAVLYYTLRNQKEGWDLSLRDR